ncbi:putative ferritin-1 [Capnocytophaga sp. oral taxon 863 str. F0517]|uniref:ferritin n=1 Tax=Capnocytophaga sp. oral taxon 863 TaxID=1227265 RepID=UPI000396A0A5|nr:ferritin [Capnocytophaga sp. oral taxon 863]ERI62992.1 putative ferritin-1 [Capnocytophaga sp. oral taxon 863 str. F0517]
MSQTRKATSLHNKVTELLQAQIAMEAHASATYLAMSSWCDDRGYKRSAAFFLNHADEERGHMLRIFNFLNENGVRAFSPEVTNIQQEYKSLKDVFEKTLEHEIAVTDSINNIVKVARQENDFASENFLQWFVNEQLEEERLVHDILDMFEFVSDEKPFAIKLLDERVPLES